MLVEGATLGGSVTAEDGSRTGSRNTPDGADATSKLGPCNAFCAGSCPEDVAGAGARSDIGGTVSSAQYATASSCDDECDTAGAGGRCKGNEYAVAADMP